jgi:hypothetical protein
VEPVELPFELGQTRVRAPALCLRRRQIRPRLIELGFGAAPLHNFDGHRV